jgi:hypothetical protein
MPELLLITLTVSPSVEESLVDWLLQFTEHSGFTSHKADGHSSRIEGLSLAEQVSGRKSQVRFQLHLPGTELDRFMAQLKLDFGGAGIHYWVAPLLDAGHI